MSNPNLAEIKELRKKRFFIELIKNTSSCSLGWVKFRHDQFKSTKDNFEFVLTDTKKEIILDVLKDGKLANSYNSSSDNNDVKTLYDTIVLIQNEQFFAIAEEERNLIEVLQWCRCTNTWDEYPEGGVVLGVKSEVHQPQRIHEIPVGGTIIGGLARDQMPERYFEEMNGGVVVGGRSANLVIGPNTYIYMWFDNSGSMNTTFTPLTQMRDNLLKEALLPFYNNDSALYDERVVIQSYPSERTLDIIIRSGFSPTAPSDYEFPSDANNVVVMLFQDESSPYIDFQSAHRAVQYDFDIVALRQRLAEFPSDFYKGVFFVVEGFINFKLGLKKVQNGTHPYSVDSNPDSPTYNQNFGLADRNEFVYKYDVTDGGTPEYYLEQVLSALEELGFEVR